MTYQQLKWLILLIPTVTVGIWEYIRHEYLLPYISMDLGNWLTPVIVLFVTFTLLTRFFEKMEDIQEELRLERAEKAALKERERIARGLHDGLAQSLFLLSIKVKKLNELNVSEADRKQLEELKDSINEIHQYVRQNIENLREPPKETEPWLKLINRHIEKFEKESEIMVERNFDMDESLLSSEEKFELASCIGEALVNVHKHAEATKVVLKIQVTDSECYVMVQDNGIGFSGKQIDDHHYGIKMMGERCNKINWNFEIKRMDGMTTLYFHPK